MSALSRSDGASDAVLLRGVVFIHSCPRALLPHVEWSLASVLGPAARLQWTPQPVLPGTSRAELGYTAPSGTAAKLASNLRTFPGLRFEITADPNAYGEGERYAYTPELGIFHATTNIHGDIMINEERLRAAMAKVADGHVLHTQIQQLLGAAWDDELESFRYAGEGAPVRWMSEVVM